MQMRLNPTICIGKRFVGFLRIYQVAHFKFAHEGLPIFDEISQKQFVLDCARRVYRRERSNIG